MTPDTKSSNLTCAGIVLFVTGLVLALTTYASAITQAAAGLVPMIVAAADRITGQAVAGVDSVQYAIGYSPELWHGFVLLMALGVTLILIGSIANRRDLTWPHRSNGENGDPQTG